MTKKLIDTYNKNPCLKQLINIEYLNTKPLQDIILESDGTLHLYSNYKVDKPERGSVFHKTEIFEASTPKSELLNILLSSRIHAKLIKLMHFIDFF